MAILEETAKLKLSSLPYQARAGLYPMLIALCLCLAFSGLWLVVAVSLIAAGVFEHMIWGVLIALCTLAYCAYMGMVAYKLFTDSKRQFELELNQSEIVLTVIDTFHGSKSTQMVNLKDISYAEYYPFPDSSCLYIYAPYTVMELPLWPFGPRGADVADFLSGRGVSVMNVLLDDKLPNPLR